MPVAPWFVVSPPKTSAPLHSLLASANIVEERDSRWEAGFTFFPENCAEAHCFGECQDRDADCNVLDPKVDCPECDLREVKYQPFTLESTYTCRSSVSNDYSFYTRKAIAQLEVAQYNAIEKEFWEGVCGPDNQHLNMDPDGAAILAGGVAQSSVLALAMLVQALSNCGSGGRGMIHAIPMLSELWTHGGMLEIRREGQRELLTTKTKAHIVVAGGGYTGTGPGGIPAPPGHAWAYATRMVDVRLGDIRVFPENFSEALDRRTNKVTVRAERTAAAVHDECCHFAVLVDLCADNGGGNV